MVVAIKKVHRVVNMKYFQNEVDLMKSIAHPNIIKLYDVLHHNNFVFMIMEYCNGGDLTRYIQKRAVKYDQRYFHQILLAFEYLNQRGIIHRDIKPQNVLIHQHCIKLSDFGFAKSLESVEDLHSTFCGSPLYMSPEILRRQSYSAQSDLWSLGVLLYELLVKEHPYLVQTTKQLMNLVENGYPIQYESIRSSYYRNIIARLLEPDVSRRTSAEVFFSSLRKNDEFLEELEDLENATFSVKKLVQDIRSVDIPQQASAPIPCKMELVSPISSIMRPVGRSLSTEDAMKTVPSAPETRTSCLSILKDTLVEEKKLHSRRNSDCDVLETAEITPSSSPPMYPCSLPTSSSSAISQHIVDNYVEEREKMTNTTYMMPVYGSSPPIRGKGINEILTKSVRSLSMVWKDLSKFKL
jgi:serine/threonine protein kinase